MSATELINESETPASPPPPHDATADGANNKKKAKSPSKSKDKRAKKKKKRISKHVLKSKEAASEKSKDSEDLSSEKQSTETTVAEAEAAMKDPTEASQYLKAWEAKEGWKFNKNTQSWLLRHMYEGEKVSKHTFAILQEYLKGLQGKDAKKRVLEEATARAQRYREYEKNKESNDATTAIDAAKDAEQPASSESSSPPQPGDATYGWEHWRGLDDHDKRKEYKRARKVLESLTAME